MKYAIQLQYDENFEYALKCSKNAGFEYVALGFGSSKCFHYDTWENDILKIEKLLNENSIKCIQTHLPYYDLKLSSEIIDETIETAMLRCIEAGEKLGSKWNVCHARSAINDNYSPRKSMEYSKIALDKIVRKAEECKSGLAIENLPLYPNLAKMRFFTADYEDLCELHDYFKSDYVSICWDFGHANLLGNDQVTALEYVGDRIKCTHIHNNNGVQDLHLLPSEGVIEWEAIMPALIRSGYKGELTLEVGYKNKPFLESYFRHALDCLKYLEDISK